MALYDLPIPRIGDRPQSYLYVERATLSRNDYGLVITDSTGVYEVPIVKFSFLMIGPGTSVTHSAVTLASEMSVSIVWVGEGGVRFYAHGTSLSSSSRFAVRQSAFVSDSQKRTEVARRMYALRFPGEDISKMSIQQLRGKEGSRVRKAYIYHAGAYGLEWGRRVSRMEKISENDEANKAITLATACLYGICHSVIMSIGAVPSLGFIHAGHRFSFVFDVADLYKTSLAVPIGFKVASDNENPATLDADIRREMREAFYTDNLPRIIIQDIKTIFGMGKEQDEEDKSDKLYLWDSDEKLVSGNMNWAGDENDDSNSHPTHA